MQPLVAKVCVFWLEVVQSFFHFQLSERWHEGETRDGCNTFCDFSNKSKPFTLEKPICSIINFDVSTTETMC